MHMSAIVVVYNTNNVPDTVLGNVISFASYHDLNKTVLEHVHNYKCTSTFTEFSNVNHCLAAN